MERVHFEQEQMLDELKDLVEKGVFTVKETKEIVRRRTAFETALVRRVSKKTDFLRYAAYEMSLEELRRKRVERLKIPTTPATISSYSLVRRQFHIFERALKKFKADVGLWIQYIKLAQREGARALVGRICARAIQLHPGTPSLYILAASHELKAGQSPAAARALLQRGVRMNKESVEMWREWVRLEMVFVESLRRRWEVLGIVEGPTTISAGGQKNGKGKVKGGEADEETGEGETEVEKQAEKDDDAGAAARKEIMEGAIVKTVISSAAAAVPKMSLFREVERVVEEHPASAGLREAVLGHLYGVVRSTLGGDAEAVGMLAGRHVKGLTSLRGVEVVEALQLANEEYLRSGLEREHGEFVKEWCLKDIDEALKKYLVCSKKD
ncbi:hypothetical protein HGRIS_002310 [Hohenbuehelia grisea]|uniref:U3 small nucleolar RNA-associated protein 6 N-terminal domain-containing protein n=1 Tax=Hohenbuehelia grisea TaxID=104357 RepID=A0ABR3JK49_9AGAR